MINIWQYNYAGLKADMNSHRSSPALSTLKQCLSGGPLCTGELQVLVHYPFESLRYELFVVTEFDALESWVLTFCFIDQKHNATCSG